MASEKIMLEGLLANNSDENVCVVMFSDPATEEVFETRFYKKRYERGENGEKGKYVADPDHEVYDASLASIKEFIDAELDFENIETEILGKTAELYVDRENGRASTKPIVSYVRFDKVETADKKQMKADPSAVYNIVSISDFPGVRFNFGFEREDKNGAIKLHRISQLVKVADSDDEEDITVSLKYQTRQMGTLEENMGRADLPSAVIEKLKSQYDKLAETAREKKAEEIEQIFGFNPLTLIEGDEDIEIPVTVEVQTIAGQNVNFCVATYVG